MEEKKLNGALIQAATEGDAEAVRRCLRDGADANAAASDTTALLEAVKNAGGAEEHTAIVNLLLEASADPDRVPVADPDGEPPGDSPLQHAAAEGLLVRLRRPQPAPAAEAAHTQRFG